MNRPGVDGANGANRASDAEEVAAVFVRAAATYETVVPFFNVLGPRLVDMAALALGERVLDVGCGRGATLLPACVAVGTSGRLVGIDLAEEMVALLGSDLEAAGLTTATVRRGDAQALDMENATFDVVLAQMVLHLLPDPARAASECFRVLVPGGRVAASAPTMSQGLALIGELFGRFAARAVRPSAVPYRPDFDLPAVLAGAGFEVTGEESVEVELRFPDEQTWWDWSWSNGIRAFYEVLSPDDLEALRTEAFAALAAIRTSDGIPITQGAHLVVAAKPRD